MELFHYQHSRPVWVSFENRTGQKGQGGLENFGAKGHACEYFANGEEKILCDIDGPGIIRKIWFTLDDRSSMMLKGISLKIYWDDSVEPAVNVPIGDFFCMGHGTMRPFENELFSSPEGRSFNCYIPMPFLEHARILLVNHSGKDNMRLFYDVDLTLEEISPESMYFYSNYSVVDCHPLDENIAVLPKISGAGRFLGMNIAVTASFEYEDSWWGEGEVKIYLDGDENPSLVGTGSEDYIGTAWGQGEFINRYQGCTLYRSNRISFYRYHVKDPIFFEEDCKVELMDMGGNQRRVVERYLQEGKKLIPVAADIEGKIIHFYKQKNFSLDTIPDDCCVYFYRQDRFEVVAYYYMKQNNTYNMH